jgi:membrane-associated phospholipid phosphatase
MDAIFSQSLELTYWLQGLGDWLKPVMEFFTFVGEERFYLLISPVLLWLIDYRLGFRVAVILLLTSGVNELLKLSFRQPRPYWLDPNAAAASSPPVGYSLPSGHSQNSASIFGLLAVALKRKWFTALMIFTIFMIGLSRVYLGVHTYVDVLTGWLVGAVVLFAYVKLESLVQGWFSSKSLGVKIGAVFLYSLLVILVGTAIIAAAGDYQMPHDWSANAHIAYPEEPIESPFNLNSTITGAAILFGMGVGYFWVQEAGGFRANSGSWWQMILRFLIGLAGVLVLYIGLGQILPDHHDLVSYLLRYLRYTLVGFWIAGIAPRLFIRSKLATPAE